MQALGPTIGRDLRAMPRGQVIPPTGLGVDLVDSPMNGKLKSPKWTDKAVRSASWTRLNPFH